MRRLHFTDLTREDITSLVKLEDHRIRADPWDELARGESAAAEQRMIDHLLVGLRKVAPSLINDATIWCRAIYPLLSLAETEDSVVQADVPLTGRIGDAELVGRTDGAFGTPIAGDIRAPFLIIHQTKRGADARNPVPQLYGELLVAACLNAEESGKTAQRLYGVYTVADNWTFVRADIEGLDSGRPSMSIVSSRELSEKSEAATIVKILKSIVAEHRRAPTRA